MSMLCAIMQPTYFPWTGYFDLIDQADKFVFLDDVQLVKRSWMVRNRIKTPQGPLFLSIPVKKTKHRDEQLLHNTELDFSQNWQKKHLNSIRLAYQKADFFKTVFPMVEDLLDQPPSALADFNIQVIRRITEALDIGNEFFRSSSMDTGDLGQAEKLLHICQSLDCTMYLSPQGSADYLEKEVPGSVFADSPVELYYMHYEHPVYPQLYGEFISHMCILDLLFNVGFEKAAEYIRSGRRPNYHYTEFRKKILNI
jgi:hypothetical protein